MAGILGLIGNVAGGLLASGAAKKSTKAAQLAQAQSLDYIKSIYPRFQQATAPDFGQQLGYLESVIPTIKEGYGQARAVASELGYASRRNVLDRAEQAKADARTGSVSRGLYGTSSHDRIARGIDSDTDRAIAEINELVAGQHVGLLTGEANALGAAAGNISAAYGNRTQQALAAITGSGSAVGNISHSPGDLPDYSYLASIGSDLDELFNSKKSNPYGYTGATGKGGLDI